MKITEEHAYNCCPSILKDSIDKYKKEYAKYKQTNNWAFVEGPYCELQSEINKAEVNDNIRPEIANYLRKLYLQ